MDKTQILKAQRAAGALARLALERGQMCRHALGHAEHGSALQGGGALVVLLLQLISVGPRRQSDSVVVAGGSTAALWVQEYASEWVPAAGTA